jgi:hypothetical protein
MAPAAAHTEMQGVFPRRDGGRSPRYHTHVVKE